MSTIFYNSVQCFSAIESLISQLPGGKSFGGRTLGRKASRSTFLQGMTFRLLSQRICEMWIKVNSSIGVSRSFNKIKGDFLLPVK